MAMRRTWPVFAGVSILAVATTGAFAQGKPGGGGRPPTPTRQTDIDRTRDRTIDRDMDRMRDHDATRDRDSDRDRIREQDRDRIYASDLMTGRERAEYQNQLRTLPTAKERVEYRLQQQKEMRDRAKQQGAKVAGAQLRRQIEEQERDRQREREQIYGYSLLSQEELNRYRERLRVATNDQQREQIRAEHQNEMQERARARGVTLQEPKR
jgi:hypothetical protein